MCVCVCVCQAYWRSCAALLGHVLDGAFKDEFSVELLKIPEVPGGIDFELLGNLSLSPNIAFNIFVN